MRALELLAVARYGPVIRVASNTRVKLVDVLIERGFAVGDKPSFAQRLRRGGFSAELLLQMCAVLDIDVGDVRQRARRLLT